MNKHDSRCQGGDDQKVLNDIAQHGWHIVNVFDSEDTPGWAFSIGLFYTFRHPEIIVFGLNPNLMQSIISSIGDAVRSGTRYEVGTPYWHLIEAYSCVFKDVNQIWYDPFLGYATWFYKGTEFPVRQCIWPDKSGLYPWEQGFRSDWLWAQPLLFHEQPEPARAITLLKSMGIEGTPGVRGISAHLVNNHSDDNWPFDQPRNCATFTMRQVLDGEEPILLIAHDADDHGWQFIGTSDATVADARLVCLEEIVHRDPTVLEVADLPPGWEAVREQVGGAWTRRQQPADPDDQT